MCSALGFWPPLKDLEPFPGRISVLPCWGRRSALYGGLIFPVRGFGFGCTSGGPTLAKNPEAITLGLKLITNCDKLIRKEICDRRCSDKRGLTATIQDRSCLKEAAEEFNGEAKMFVLCEGTVRVDATCQGPKAERERRRVAKVAPTTTTKLSNEVSKRPSGQRVAAPFQRHQPLGKAAAVRGRAHSANMPATPPSPHLRSGR